jgi:hypothetical protein
VYEKDYQIFNIKNLTTIRIFQQDIPEETFQEVADIAKEAVQKLRMLNNFKRKLILLRMEVSNLKQYLKY